MSWVFFFPNLYIRFSTTLAASLAAKVTTNVVAARETVSTFVVGTLLQNLYDFQVGTFLLNLFDFHIRGLFYKILTIFKWKHFSKNFLTFLSKVSRTLESSPATAVAAKTRYYVSVTKIYNFYRPFFHSIGKSACEVVHNLVAGVLTVINIC